VCTPAGGGRATLDNGIASHAAPVATGVGAKKGAPEKLRKFLIDWARWPSEAFL